MQVNNNPMNPSDAKERDFLDYLEIILPHKKMVLWTTISVFVVTLTISFLSTPIYQSTTRFLPPQQDAQGLAALMMGGMGGAISSLAGSVLGTGTVADQYASMLESEQMMDTIIDRFQLMKEYDKDYRLAMYKKMNKLVTIKAGKKDGIISVAAEDADPKKAAEIANAYVDELGKLIAQMSIADADKDHGFYEGRLARAKADLVRAENALNTFQTKHKAINVTEQAKATIEGVALLKGQIAVQQAQLSALRSTFTETTPEVKAVRATIGNLSSQLAQLEGKGKSAAAIPTIGALPDLGQEQVRLLREYKIQETLVEMLTKQDELAKLTEARNVNGIQVIQKAKPSDHEARMLFRKRYVVMLTLLAFAASVSWALWQNHRDQMPADRKERLARVLGMLWSRKGRSQVRGVADSSAADQA